MFLKLLLLAYHFHNFLPKLISAKIFTWYFYLQHITILNTYFSIPLNHLVLLVIKTNCSLIYRLKMSFISRSICTIFSRTMPNYTIRTISITTWVPSPPSTAFTNMLTYTKIVRGTQQKHGKRTLGSSHIRVGKVDSCSTFWLAWAPGLTFEQIMGIHIRIFFPLLVVSISRNKSWYVLYVLTSTCYFSIWLNLPYHQYCLFPVLPLCLSILICSNVRSFHSFRISWLF